VFCGSSRGTDPAHAALARALGAALAERRMTLIFGGGRVGLMGVIADAALAAGGPVIGVIPEFLKRPELAHGGVADMIVVESMHARKQRMFELADAFAVLPGGIGTLDEAIEVITWKQLGLHDKPVLLVDSRGYWQPLRALLAHAASEGFFAMPERPLYRLVGSVEGLFSTLASLPAIAPLAEADRL